MLDLNKSKKTSENKSGISSSVWVAVNPQVYGNEGSVLRIKTFANLDADEWGSNLVVLERDHRWSSSTGLARSRFTCGSQSVLGLGSIIVGDHVRNLSADCTRLVIPSREYHHINGRSINELKTEKHPVVSEIFATWLSIVEGDTASFILTNV
jgi:hypothetical protein